LPLARGIIRGMSILRPFVEHPAAVGETYAEHLGMASSFGFRLIGAGLACLLHGLFPFAFTTTGSACVRKLHDDMVAHRRKADRASQGLQPAE
jgi:hypothetical protein